MTKLQSDGFYNPNKQSKYAVIICECGDQYFKDSIDVRLDTSGKKCFICPECGAVIYLSRFD